MYVKKACMCMYMCVAHAAPDLMKCASTSANFILAGSPV